MCCRDGSCCSCLALKRSCFNTRSPLNAERWIYLVLRTWQMINWKNQWWKYMLTLYTSVFKLYYTLSMKIIKLDVMAFQERGTKMTENTKYTAKKKQNTPIVRECLASLYIDVIMTTVASQITSLTIAYSIAYSEACQRKHQSSASLAFVRGIHRGPVNSPHKWPVTRKMFPFDDVIMSFATTGSTMGCPDSQLTSRYGAPRKAFAGISVMS